MKTKGILSKPDLAVLINQELKTETRRIISIQPPSDKYELFTVVSTTGPNKRIGRKFWGLLDKDRQNILGESQSFKAPYSVGDILYIREEHYLYGSWKRNGKTKLGKQKWKFTAVPDMAIGYSENPPPKICSKKTETGWFKRNSLFMPKYAARTYVEVTGIRAERLHKLEEEGAIREGVRNLKIHGEVLKINPIAIFIHLWDEINDERGYAWFTNPIVWVMRFKRVYLNIVPKA